MTHSPQPETRDLAQQRSWAISVLSSAGVPEAEVDAELLLGFVLGLSRGEIAAKVVTGFELTAAQQTEFTELLHRRENREPLQHILGVAWFRTLSLAVGPGVFIPRPETEQLAGMAIDSLRSLVDPEPIAVDLGTGSGAIALALATEVPHAQVFAVEKSADAFQWARKNFDALNRPNAHLVLGDMAGKELLTAFPHLQGAVSVIVSNPPYIPSAAIPRDPEVRLFDPELALYGGEDGLDLVRKLSEVGMVLGRPGSQILLEHGELQGQEIRDILSQAGWRAPTTHRDLTGRDRFTTALHA